MRRLEVLQIFHDRNLDDWDYKAGPERIMYEIYGHSWKAHADNTRLYRYYELTLKSLAASGDLTVNQSIYQIAPQALETLFHADENKRRHDDLQGQQTAMRRLTTALVLVGILQAVVAGIGPIREFLQPSPAPVETSQPASSTSPPMSASPADESTRGTGNTADGRGLRRLPAHATPERESSSMVELLRWPLARLARQLAGSIHVATYGKNGSVTERLLAQDLNQDRTVW